jgi:hypothetical protein
MPYKKSVCCRFTITWRKIMEEQQHFYAILGVPITASLDEIHKSYRNLAKDYHPDIKGAEVHEKMVCINNAYRILKEQLSRDEYNFNELLRLRKLPMEVQERLPSKLTPRKSRPIMQTVVKKITGKPTIYTMTAVAIHFRTAMMYATSPKPMHQEMAIEELKKGLELEPKHSDSLYNIGVLYCRLGEFANGQYYLKKYLEVEKDELVKEVLSYLAQKMKDMAEHYKTKKLE